jgi:hypothetical protein
MARHVAAVVREKPMGLRKSARSPETHAGNRGLSMKLSDLAQVIRSKNAGPRRLTLDVMFATDADYQRVAQSPALGAEAVGRLYGVPADQVTVIPYPAGRAIKIVMARKIMAGDPGDVDVYGAQQHAPLLGIEL